MLGDVARLPLLHREGYWHCRDPFAATAAHVNTAESFNAILKRCRVGVHHWWSIKHSHRYLNQIVFHWNHRGADVATRLTDLFRARGSRLLFRECLQ